MIYEKPRLIELGPSTARGGDDCTPAGTAVDKCTGGGLALQGDCVVGGGAGSKCDTGGGVA